MKLVNLATFSLDYDNKPNVSIFYITKSTTGKNGKFSSDIGNPSLNFTYDILDYNVRVR